MAKIANKKQCSAMFASGCFGNHLRQWPDIESVLKSGYSGKLMLRSMGVGGGRVISNLSVEEASGIRGFVPGLNYFSEQLNDPDEYTVILQGEVFRSYRGLDLTYTKVNAPMREALSKRTDYAHGLTALMMLRNYCCPRGLDCIQELLDIYEDHVIEFTCVDKPFGSLGWSTIIWEVRSY
jgi:hypothetical protein